MSYERLSAPDSAGTAPFLLVYFTFFLDNMLLTVLVPIIPDWVRGEALAQWAEGGPPLAHLLNATVRHAALDDGEEGAWSQLAAGAVLSAKAGAQLACAAPAAALTARLGPATALQLATLTLALAAAALVCCGGATCAGVSRGAQGAGAALAGVAGLALVSRAAPARLAALLGAVALGVLVGYPFGGAAYELWSEAAPFQIIAAAFLADLGMQYAFLKNHEYNERIPSPEGDAGGACGSCDARALRAEARGAGGAGAGALLAATAALAALEPCLPHWLQHTMHPQRWALGAIFLPDSVGYLVATCWAARGLWAAEPLALGGLAAVALGAALLPAAASLPVLAFCQLCMGAGVGCVDAALVPALLARAPRSRLPHRAALLQAAASAALAIGPVLGGVLAAWLGFAAAMRALAAANALYALVLYGALKRDPLSEQWGAAPLDDAKDSGKETPPEAAAYTHSH